jgi:hypothetical protein
MDKSMRGILVLAILSIKSNYPLELEFPLEDEADVPDTLQWWFGDGGCWRIRTYAMDHDIHVHKIGESPQTTLNLAIENNLKHYGDVIKVQRVIRFVNCAERPELEAKFQQVGLIPRIQIDPGGFAFWKPDEAEYSTKSTPK